MERRVVFSGWLFPALLLLPQLAVTLVFFFWPAAQAILQSVRREDAFGLSTRFVGAENFVLDEAGGSIAFRFHARDAHLVLSSEGREPIPFRVRLDGEVPGQSHGLDVDEDGNGLLQEGRLYQLARANEAVRDRTLEIEFLEPGAEAYVFTFG